MPYIQPNSIIKIGRSALQINSEDTYYWSSVAEQTNNIFASVELTVNKCTYQRELRNYIRVAGNAEDYHNCNYLAFQNTSFTTDTTRWFYAFILDIEYINNDVMEIHYEIDWIQSYFFDFYLNGCYIERAHSLTDNVGDNIVPEGLDIGEYIYNTSVTVMDISTSTAIIFVEANTAGELIDNVFSSVTIRGLPITLVNKPRIVAYINSKTPTQDIIASYIIPIDLYNMYIWTDPPSPDLPSVLGKADTYIDIPMTGLLGTETVDGYSPKNKKLFTYPFTFMELSDMNNNTLIMRYEFMQNIAAPKARMWGSLVPPAQMVIKPVEYKTFGDIEQSLTLSNFPLSAWAYDAYDTWLSRSLTPTLIKSVATAVGAGIAYKAGLPLYADIASKTAPVTADGAITGPNMSGYQLAAQSAGITSGANTIGNILADGYTASISADIIKGNFTSNGSNIPTNVTNIKQSRVSVNHQYAKMIDDYFTMYGYASKELAGPTYEFKHRRSRFTYIKTIGAIVLGQLPQEAMKYIADRFNRGIRFWADYNHIYNYELANTPLP